MTCNRKALTEKMIVLGVDGLDPSLAKKFMDQGKMPNLKQFVERGACREDLVLLGAVPTVTPPMWTTLATGAYPMTHGITAFYNPHPDYADSYIYSLDSKMCKAEPVWNVFAEAGKKTLVWHWPGSSWPPTSDNPNLHVVDGTQPGAVNMGTAIVDWETIVYASEDVENVSYSAHDAPNNPGVGCVITDVDELEDVNEGKGASRIKGCMGAGPARMHVVLRDKTDTEIYTLGMVNLNMVNSPIKPAQGWTDAPADAKEFTVLTSDGFVRRPALILKNEAGIYDKVAIYKSKKESEPIVVVEDGALNPDFIDEVVEKDQKYIANRDVSIIEIAPDGSKVRLWMSVAYDMKKNALFHPAELFDEIVENIGVIPPISMATGKEPEYVKKLLLPAWDNYSDWQARALTYLMDEDYEVIFSHLHNVDLCGHQFWHYAQHRDEWGNDEKLYQGFLEYVYKTTDNYLGRFLPYLDKGWSMVITSDHGLICEENEPPGMGETANNANVMLDLGYTVLKKDENGNDLPEVDLTKSKACMNRGGQININLKGKYPDGIVDPSEKDELVNKIIDDLYNYRDPHTGRRVVALAFKNRDAAMIGMGGDLCGDIICFMDEGFNIIHMDSLATQRGYFDTSVSPIFIAAGPGIKEGCTTERVIRQVDVAPTLAALGGVRMPHECEGAPAYQILTEEF